MITRMESELRIDDKILDYELISVDDYTITGTIDERFYRDVVLSTQPESKEDTGGLETP